MEQGRLTLFFLLAVLISWGSSMARKIEHVVVNEKIDRVGSLQNGGSGENFADEI